MRWSLRAVYIGGAYLGWRAGRPRWFYPWLGFACLRSRRNAIVACCAHHGRRLFPGLQSRIRLPWASAISTRFRPLFWGRSLGRLAAVATAFGRLYRLSPRRVDHSSHCGHRVNVECHLGRNALACRPLPHCAPAYSGTSHQPSRVDTRTWGARACYLAACFFPNYLLWSVRELLGPAAESMLLSC